MIEGEVQQHYQIWENHDTVDDISNGLLYRSYL